MTDYEKQIILEDMLNRKGFLIAADRVAENASLIEARKIAGDYLGFTFIDGLIEEIERLDRIATTHFE
ncbi:MAG: hypothetical protein COX52_10405 [Syntrophobacterales bacterium CG23_combo_of_CG06-09_8_20_14_all_48_27]|nr:MAG: hypothetical protein COX52_10405 [Syntrophobacterales bacterium CG23_combo_of_CG06-09_8_20_14_all_48_27]